MAFADQPPFKILHLIMAITETNGQYNEHCLPEIQRRDLTICTFSKSQLVLPPGIRLFEGDGTVRGFFRTVKTALGHQDYDVIHAHAAQSGLFFALSQWRNKAVRAKSVYTVQNSYPSYSLRNRLFMLLVFVWFRRIVMCSNACRDSYPAVFRYLLGNRVRVVQNPVDLERVDRVLGGYSPQRDGRPFRFIDVNRLIDIKNPLGMLKAFEKLPNGDSHLWFLGKGHLDGRLQSEIERAGLGQRVRLTGLIPRDDVYRRLADADVFVSPSFGEGLPVAVLEAMGCGRPVILSDIPPHREIADGADFIPLLSPDDVDGFAREMQRYREMTPDELREIGDKCRRVAQQRFSLASLREGYEDIYRGLRA